MGVFDGVLRRVRRGKPIVVVSGLPRSGTSMAMKMLEAGGLPILTDGIRAADISNPKGYYEYEPVKQLDKGGEPVWLADARGQAVKIISFLLTYLPETYDYQVIFMQQAGRNTHDHICQSLELFASDVMPEFKAEVAARETRKAAELAPFVQAALARKQWMTPLADGQVPVVKASVARAQTSATTRQPVA